jgi:hypothetical protein
VFVIIDEKYNRHGGRMLRPPIDQCPWKNFRIPRDTGREMARNVI